MAESRWSMATGTTAEITDIDPTSTAPPISSYRALYHHAAPPATSAVGEGGAGVPTIPSPDHPLVTPMPTAIPPSTTFDTQESFAFSPSEWTHRNSHHYPVDVARVQIKPNARNSVSSSEPDIFKRSINERLDKYMVIRQRTFHGLIRSKTDLTKLPLTDPRETLSEGSTPTWLHRSKTDLYIEKWRSKSNAKNRQRSKSGSTSLDLSGMTFQSLYESLPSGRLSKSQSLPSSTSRKEVQFAPPSKRPAAASNGSETRFPPLASCPVKRTAHDTDNARSYSVRDRLSIPDVTTIPTPSSTTKVHHVSPPKRESSSKVLTVPSQTERGNNSVEYRLPAHERQNRDDPAETDRAREKVQATDSPPTDHDKTSQPVNSTSSWKSGSKGQGQLQKQSLSAIPLQLWEPSFDCVVVSSQKVRQPRHLVKTWHNGAVKPEALK